MCLFRIGSMSSIVLLAMTPAAAVASDCRQMAKFAGICTGMTSSEVRSRADIRFGAMQGGRGCDYRDGVMEWRGRKYPVMLGFAGKNGPLAEYSITIPLAEVPALVDAMTTQHGTALRSRWLDQAGRKRYFWRSGPILIEVERIPRQAWLNFTDDRYRCDTSKDL